MEYMGTKEFWDEKFENRGEMLLDPENSLVENLAYFKKGSVLDVACGDGRNTIFLIIHGFEVTGIDFSDKALDRLSRFLDHRNLSGKIKQVDLSQSNALKTLGMFDNIVINHYRLNKNQLSELKNHITENGILFVSGFGDKHKVDSRIREDDLIQSTDFEEIKEEFDLIKFDEVQDERGRFVTYIFKKK